MKITIDTKEDSQDEIKKVIRLLTHLIGEHPVTNQPNIFEDSDSFGASSSNEETTSNTGNVFGNMFDTPAQSEITETEEKDDDDTPEVIPY